MPLRFDLSLEDRHKDRVFVSVLLAPDQDGTAVDGVAVMLVGKTGECMSNRLLLPISGVLYQSMLTTVELRAFEALGTGARIVGTAWTGAEQWEASCPADPGTHLEDHMRGRGALQPRCDSEFEGLTCGDRSALAGVFPWLTPCEPRPPKVVEPELETATTDEIRSFCSELGLDDEDSDWLEALLEED
ncbi:MAG: hypothetical protein R3F61_36205 [Myxococcota bacterium]